MKRLRKVVWLVMSFWMVFFCLMSNAEMASAEVRTGDERLISSYYEAIDNKDWNTWLSLLGSAYANSMESHLTDESYQNNKFGVLAIENVEDISSIQKIETQGYETIIESCEGENLEVYLVQTELAVSKENEFYFDGVNYNLVIVGTVDDSRKIVGVRLPLTETVEKYQTESAAEAYEHMRLDDSASTCAISTTNCSYNSTPSTITVWRWKYGSGTYESVDFNKYVKVVTAGEFGYVGRDADYHYAGALAIKSYAIYKIKTADPNAAYHVTDTNETDENHTMSCQVYNPSKYWDSTTWGTIYTRVDTVWSKNIFGTGYTRMDTQYRVGTGSGNTGIMYQETANSLANQGKTYEEILNYFYGSSGQSTSDIILVSSGGHVYYKSVFQSDGTVYYYCRCGYIKTMSALVPTCLDY